MIECNVYFQREDEKQYLDSKNILLEAWSPLKAGNKEMFSEPILLQIAKNHQKSVAQIVLRWLIQRKIVPVVKSSNAIRMKENIDIFNFSLTVTEMDEISKLDRKTSSSLRIKGTEVEEF